MARMFQARVIPAITQTVKEAVNPTSHMPPPPPRQNATPNQSNTEITAADAQHNTTNNNCNTNPSQTPQFQVVPPPVPATPPPNVRYGYAQHPPHAYETSPYAPHPHPYYASIPPTSYGRYSPMTPATPMHLDGASSSSNKRPFHQTETNSQTSQQPPGGRFPSQE